MKKIITRDKQAKKDKKNQLIIGGILIVVMLFSTIGFAFGNRSESDSKKIEYNGVDFVQDNSGEWRFKVDGQEFVTKYNPIETAEVSFFGLLSINDYVNKPLYFVGGASDVSYEIVRNLGKYVLRIQEACLDENCSEDFPIKNCSVDNVVVFEESNQENIYAEDNCVFISSSFENQTIYADAFLFKILGI